MAAYGGVNSVKPTKVPAIDLRSDTFTKPTQEMYEAIVTAELGDDVFGEDPTINLLEQRGAELVGKSHSVFVPTATMANLLAVMTHCWGRGYSIVLGDRSHLYKYEQGGSSHIAGAQMKVVANLPDGTFDVERMKSLIETGEDFHNAETRLICVENTHNMCGGVVVPLDFCEKVSAVAKDRGLATHLDGARVLNASVALNVQPEQICRHFDSVTLCLSKGVGAPVGALLCGDEQLVHRARRLRKMVGGGMRQAGVIAACGLVGLHGYRQRMATDHDNARTLASAISTIRGLKIDESSVQSNMVFFTVSAGNAEEVSRQLAERSIGMIAITDYQIRAVTHHQVSGDQIDNVVRQLTDVMHKLCP